MDSALQKDKSYYPQVFLKEFRFIEKKVIRYINYSLSDFPSSDKADDFDEKQIKDMRLTFVKKATIFWGSNFEYKFFEGGILSKQILRIFWENIRLAADWDERWFLLL